MAKPKIKLDTAQIKAYLIAKGERIALGVAAGLMVLLLLSGIWMSMGATANYEEVKQSADSLTRMAMSPTPSEQANEGEEIKGEWNAVDPGAYPSDSWFDPGAVGHEKLVNPGVLSILTNKQDQKFIQVDVVRGPVLVHKLTQAGVKILEASAVAGEEGTAPGPVPMGEGEQTLIPLARYLEPKRMVVVNAVFPYERQLKLIQDALLKNSIQEVVANPKIRPKFVGLNVVRCEMDEDGKCTLTKLYGDIPQFQNDDLQKLSLAERKGLLDYAQRSKKEQAELERLFTLAQFDVMNFVKIQPYVKPGLVTPLPKLAKGFSYPELKLSEIDLKKNDLLALNGETETDTMPLPMPLDFPGVSGEEMETPGATTSRGIKDLPLKKLQKADPILADKLRGKYELFHPLGDSKRFSQTMEGEEYAVEPLMEPEEIEEMPGFSDETEIDPFMPQAMIPKYVMVRFVDVNPQPGKKYKYFVQVRMANPNFGKDREQLLYPDLGKVKELVSAWTQTPETQVDEEYQYFVADQHQLHPESVLHLTESTATESTKDSTKFIAVQIHRWIKSYRSSSSLLEPDIGAWAIADRLIARRGEILGEKSVEVQMPVWNVGKDGFELKKPKPMRSPKRINGKVVREYKTGEKVNFLPKDKAPLVVDFKGGHKYHRILNNNYDKSAVQMLVLSPEGKLLAFDSREDSDPATERGKKRLERYEQWRSWVESLIPKAAPPGSEMEEPGGDLPGFGCE